MRGLHRAVCPQEVWAGPEPGGMGGELGMTMLEMAVEYRVSAQRLRQRQAELRAILAQMTQEKEIRCMEERIRTLHLMWLETRDIAVLLERYYERGYRKNDKYTL